MSMAWPDVYGEEGASYQEPAPITASGYMGNQSFVAPWGSSAGSVGVVGSGGNGPALSIVGLVVALVLLRIVIELGGEA